MRRLMTLLLIAMTAACGSADPEAGSDCRSAPPDERVADLPFAISLDPDAVVAGAEAVLEFGGSGRGNEEVTGWGSAWECWTGAEWIPTHLLGHHGSVVPREAGVPATMPAVGYRIPDAFTITIPDVPPGWYRLRSSSGNREWTLPVEVVDAG